MNEATLSASLAANRSASLRSGQTASYSTSVTTRTWQLSDAGAGRSCTPETDSGGWTARSPRKAFGTARSGIVDRASRGGCRESKDLPPSVDWEVTLPGPFDRRPYLSRFGFHGLSRPSLHHYSAGIAFREQPARVIPKFGPRAQCNQTALLHAAFARLFRHIPFLFLGDQKLRGLPLERLARGHLRVEPRFQF
jgi:hypothetical protein